MITSAKPATPSRSQVHHWNTLFLAMLSSIQRQARFAFANEPAEQREDLIAEVLANTFVAFIRLARRGRFDVALPTPLAQYAIRQVRSGRRVGNRMNIRDVTSEYAQHHKRFSCRQLDVVHSDGGWWAILVEDRKATPADIAATRIDFRDWLQKLPVRRRQIAEVLATGETTKEAAERFRLSPGRVSQMRRELKDSWEAFQGV